MSHKDPMNEEQLEKLLRQMPKVRDERNPLQIYQAIQPMLAKKPQKKRIMPAIALAAALVLLAIVAPMFIQNMQLNSISMNESSDNAEEQGMRNFAEDSADNGEAADDAGDFGIMEDSDSEDAMNDGARKESEQNEFSVMSAEKSFVVPGGNEETEHVVMIGVTASEAMSDFSSFSFPISVIVNKANEESYFTALEHIRYEIDYNGLGLETPRINDGLIISEGTDEEGNARPMIEVGDLLIGYSSLNTATFNQEISETFRWNFSSIQYTQNGSTKNVEMLEDVKNDPEIMERLQRKAYFKYQSNDNAPTFLVPGQDNEKFENITQALDAMKEKPDQYEDKNKLDPSIPASIEIEGVETDGDGGKLVTINMASTNLLENTDSTIFALEAMMMTAKEFGFEQVVFKTSQDGFIGGIPLNEPVNVPYSPNPIPYPQ